MYADVHGHIGYQAPGLIPIRRTGNGDWPVPGWDPAYEWDTNAVPFDALPNVLDPEDGYVVTANQAVVGKRYPYYIGDSFDYGFRSQRIRDLLAATPEADRRRHGEDPARHVQQPGPAAHAGAAGRTAAVAVLSPRPGHARRTGTTG